MIESEIILETHSTKLLSLKQKTGINFVNFNEEEYAS